MIGLRFPLFVSPFFKTFITATAIITNKKMPISIDMKVSP
ncbi:hypothetical protein AB895_1983 [Acinetobacter baumannii]|nr:hypothetical protein J635_3228 [Acinetobacter baumannii 233846]KMV08713.1 hypothetical protein AB895_1983 [Acinetobacter baumannii]